MAHRLDKHYSDFGGLDTRSNVLKQIPETQRVGTKNNRITFQDEIAKRYGFQHNDELLDRCSLGLIEYKFRDINTGESKTQVLGVDSIGDLHFLTFDTIRFTVTSASAVVYYSFFYDGTNYVLSFYNASQVLINSVTVALTDDLNTVNAAVNALAIAGLTSAIFDRNGDPSTSTELAYHIDVVNFVEFDKSITDTIDNSVNFWASIIKPDASIVFAAASANKDNPEWEGMSSVNLYNSLYITDGGFVFKYDGYAVYKAGMPRTIGAPNSQGPLSIDGFALTPQNGGGSMTVNSTYRYKFQYCFKDPNGNEVCGKITNGMSVAMGAVNDEVTIAVPPIRNDTKFPVFACVVNGNQDLATANKTFNVDAGHNISVGMTLRIPVTSTPLGIPGYSFMYCLVTAITATTITVSDVPIDNLDYPWGGATTTIINDQTINAGFLPQIINGKITDIAPSNTSYILPEIFCGAFVKVFRTQANGTVFYHLIDLPCPKLDGPATKLQFIDFWADTGSGGNLSPFALDEFSGEEFPRLCKYIGEFQGQLVQGGRPYDTSSIINSAYPTRYDASPTNDWGLFPTGFKPFLYGENDICDFQSIFWNDLSNGNIEGFPQSGLNEEDFVGRFNDQITGFIENKEALFVFKDRTTAYLTGTLATGDLVKEILEADVGSVNMNSLQQVRGEIVFLDKYSGFWSVVAGRLPQPLGWPITDQFEDNNLQASADFLRLKRANSCNFKLDNQYICFIPAGISGNPATGSKFFVLDYSQQGAQPRITWSVWQGLDAYGGILATSNDELLVSQRINDNSQLWKQKRSNSIYDYSDHITAIEWLVKSAFLNYGTPTVDKNFYNVWINSIEGGFDLTVQQYANYTDTSVADFDLFMPLPADKKTVKQFVNCNKDKLSSLSIGFYNNEINQDVRIEGWELEYSDTYDKGEPVK